MIKKLINRFKRKQNRTENPVYLARRSDYNDSDHTDILSAIIPEIVNGIADNTKEETKESNHNSNNNNNTVTDYHSTLAENPEPSSFDSHSHDSGGHDSGSFSSDCGGGGCDCGGGGD